MQNHQTALYVAYASGHMEVAAILIEHGANVVKEDMVSIGKMRDNIIAKSIV